MSSNDWANAGLPPGRTFETGATRDSDAGKLDFEAFLSVRALRAYAEYMHSHRAFGDVERTGDNWQRGIPLDAYMKSLWRHMFDVWAFHRHERPLDAAADEVRAVCAVIFNAFGMLHELTRPEQRSVATCVLCHSFLFNHVDGQCPQ